MKVIALKILHVLYFKWKRLQALKEKEYRTVLVSTNFQGFIVYYRLKSYNINEKTRHVLRK